MKRVLCLLAAFVSIISTTVADDPLVGVLIRHQGPIEISVIFQEPVSTTSLLTLENYKVAGAEVVQLRLAATNQGVILSTSGLSQGASSTLAITGMVNAASTKLPDYFIPFEVTNRFWAAIGGNELGFTPDVLAVSTNGFDLFSGGIQQTDDYDEATFAGQELEGDFDQVVRVLSVDPAGRNAKAGIMIRENLDFGIGRPVDPEDPATMFSRYIELAVNAPQSAANEPGYGGHRIFMRQTTGSPSLESLSVTNDAPPAYSNAWLRVKRVGDEFKMYRGTNGVVWEQIGSATFPQPAPDKLLVGVAFSPQNDDLFLGSGLRDLFVAKFRNYSVTNSPSARITIEKLPAPGQAQLSWPSGPWILQSTTSLPGTWSDTQNQQNPQTISVNLQETARFYRLRR